MVKRITITIKPDILKRIDNMVDGKHIRNRSHAIENLIEKSLSKTGIEMALILAGGVGAKLRPITYELPKAMIPIHGKPILEHQIAMFRKYGVKDIVVSLGHLNEKVHAHFGDGRKFSVQLRYLLEKNSLGTAGALYAAKDMIKDTFVVGNVDTLLAPNIPEIIEFHKKQGKVATMLLTTTEHTDKVGVAKMRGNSIVEFVEKPAHAESNLVNAGLYIFEPAIKKFLRKKGRLEKIVFPMLARTGQLAGYVYDGAVFDVGFLKGYERAIKLWEDV